MVCPPANIRPSPPPNSRRGVASQRRTSRAKACGGRPGGPTGQRSGDFGAYAVGGVNSTTCNLTTQECIGITGRRGARVGFEVSFLSIELFLEIYLRRHLQQQDVSNKRRHEVVDDGVREFGPTVMPCVFQGSGVQ